MKKEGARLGDQGFHA